VVYCEGQSFKSTFAALKYLLGLALFGLCLYIPPLRFLLFKYVLPAPGAGPSEDAMRAGFLHATGHAVGTEGTKVSATMSFNVDPGYMDTARMLVESGLTLSLDGAKLRSRAGGVFTPAACQGEALLDRLLKTGTTFAYH
jgi:short subunit dehydrogenase-like uncharacterized protein